MIEMFSKNQQTLVFRLMEAPKEKLERMVRVTRPGNMQHSKSELIRSLLNDATQDTSRSTVSHVKTVETLRAKLCEERLAEWHWFDMTPPEEREEDKP
jgi:hypothetical protein